MRYLKRGSRRNRRGRSRSKRLHEEEDPLSGVANLFDVAMLFGTWATGDGTDIDGNVKGAHESREDETDNRAWKMMKMAPTDQMVTVTCDIVESGTLYEVKQSGG